MIKKIKLNKSLSLLIFSFLLPWSQHAFSRTVTDMSGRHVQVPETISRVYTDRFTSLLVFAIDPVILCNSTFAIAGEAKKYIAADYAKKPLTRDADEEILKLHPNVIIIGNTGGNKIADDADRMQQKLKIPVLVVDFLVGNSKASFAFLGEALGRKNEAIRLQNFIQQYVEPLKQKVKSSIQASKYKVYYAEGLDGLSTEPSGSIHSQILDYLMVNNVAKTSAGDIHGMSSVSMEQLMVWNPDVILVWTGFPAGMGMGNNGHSNESTYSHILNDALWNNIKAVKDKKVYQIPSLPFGWFDRPPSSNCIPGVIWTAKVLYPDLISYDMKEALKSYFLLFYHVSLSDKDIAFILSH
jgi:iron complex transport system substrate-binding protein